MFAPLLIRWKYRHLLKPILFRIDPSRVHEAFCSFGAALGKVPFLWRVTAALFAYEDSTLVQTVAGMRFENPIGLSAGFDYKAKLMDILPSIGFGFGSVGTITNEPYEGNPAPMLGRLPRSRSLLVNKGFKNFGIDELIGRLSGRAFAYPVGLSLGKTNRHEPMTQEEAVADVVAAFQKAVAAHLAFSYYELNISCPNLFGSVSFYSPGNLHVLLAGMSVIAIDKPVFVKMPICEADPEFSAMLEVLAGFPFVKGVIIGNLQHDRAHPSFVKEEIACATKGNFSGKPCFDRSSELIRLAYRAHKDRFAIIGCGGVFSAEDAYEKIRSGASLVQMITGMIFEGPQVIGEINRDLVRFLKRDGYANVAEAVGAAHRA